MPRKDAPGGAISAQAQQDLVSDGIENFELPKSLVTKIAKSALPESAKLQKETVLSLVKGSTVFINYLAATAHDVAISKQHKSISASDVLKALEMIEFGDLVDKLQTELVVYRANVKTDKKKAPTSTSGPTTSTSISIPPSTSISAPANPTPSNTSAAPLPPSIPAPKAAGKKASTAKGKEKEKDLGTPFTSAPLVTHGNALMEQMERDKRMDVDWEEELGEAATAATAYTGIPPSISAPYDGEEDDEVDEEGDIVDEDEPVDEDDEGDVGADDEEEEDVEGEVEGGEETEDPMEVEEAELKDERGLDDAQNHHRNGVAHGMGSEHGEA